MLDRELSVDEERVLDTWEQAQEDGLIERTCNDPLHVGRIAGSARGREREK